MKTEKQLRNASWYFKCTAQGNAHMSMGPPGLLSLSKTSGSTKACNESYEEQLPDFDSWALTAGILLNKVLFFSNKRTRL